MSISSYDDIIDSRDVIARIEELEDLRDSLEDDDGFCQGYEAGELGALQELAREAPEYAPDWDYGEVLIRDSYFKTYAQQLAEEIGAINSDATWPNTCIDWDQAASELQQDYTMVDFDGSAYWIR